MHRSGQRSQKDICLYSDDNIHNIQDKGSPEKKK